MPEYVFGTRVIGDSVWAFWSWISGGQALGTLLESTAPRVAKILSLAQILAGRDAPSFGL